MYVNIGGPSSLTLIGIRKTHFREFSCGAGGFFNLRHRRWELSSQTPAGLAGRFVRGIQLTEQIALFTYKGKFYFFLSRPIKGGTDSGILASMKLN